MADTNTHTRLPRPRWRFAALLVALSLLGGYPLPAEGQTRKELNDARGEYKRIQSRLDQLVSEYAEAKDQLTLTGRKISTTKSSISHAEGRIGELQGRLKTRVREAYQSGGLGFFEFLLSAQSFRDFSVRMMTLQRQTSADEGLMLELRKARSDLQIKKRDLEAQKQREAAEKSALEKRVQGLNASLSEAQSTVKNLKAKLTREEQQRLFRAVSSRGGGGGGGGGGGRVIALTACPAAGPHAFSNDWGAPRGGGRRRHKGNDIFAPMGSPAAAVVSGRISRLGSGGLGGLSVYLMGDDGNEYYYAHMSGFNVSQGQRVSGGQTIATVGNTGNARGGSPHIHFEVHPGGGGAINPYPSLIRVC